MEQDLEQSSVQSDGMRHAESNGTGLLLKVEGLLETSCDGKDQHNRKERSEEKNVGDLLQCPPHHTGQLLSWLSEGNNDAISNHFVKVLTYLDKKLYIRMGDAAQYYVNRVVQDLLFIFAQSEFTIPARFAEKFVELNTVIANAVAVTPFETTDACLELICNARQSQGNPIKVCALYSCRNRIQIDRRQIVDGNPGLASLWYSSYMCSYMTAVADPDCLARMREHILFADNRLDLTMGHPAALYYGATYVDHCNDRLVKRRVNEAFQAKDASIVFKRKPRTEGRHKIAVISDLWRKTHSACRVQYQFVAALKLNYHLTLVHGLHRDLEKFDIELFDEIVWVGGDRGVIDVAPILESCFDVAYFPDVGMTDPSIRLANMRIAPIQIMGPGHPVSTWGSQIDYFVTGAENELPNEPGKHYSEKLILLPGMGAIHKPITHPRKERKPSLSPLIVNCPWSPQKTNAPLLRTLAKVVARTITRPVFRFFPSTFAAQHCGAIAYRRRLASFLGNNHFEICHGLNYSSYMDMLEEGAFTIDSYPYGGGNVIADSLHMRRPILCLEGEHWYNRMGPAMLRKVGLDELVASTEEDFVETMVSLIDNDAYRQSLTERLQNASVDLAIFNDSTKEAFILQIDSLLSCTEKDCR